MVEARVGGATALCSGSARVWRPKARACEVCFGGGAGPCRGTSPSSSSLFVSTLTPHRKKQPHYIYPLNV